MSASALLPPQGDTPVRSHLLPVRSGRGSVTATTSGVIGRLVARLIGLRPGTTTSATLTVEPRGSVERWVRHFGARRWSSTLRPGTSEPRLLERLGPLTLHFDTFVGTDGAATMTLDGVHVGPARLPLRDAVSITGRIDDGGTTVDVRILGGSCRYDVQYEATR